METQVEVLEQEMLLEHEPRGEWFHSFFLVLSTFPLSSLIPCSPTFFYDIKAAKLLSTS